MRTNLLRRALLGILFLAAVMPIGYPAVSALSKNEYLQTYSIKAKIDQRFELMSIIACERHWRTKDEDP